MKIRNAEHANNMIETAHDYYRLYINEIRQRYSLRALAELIDMPHSTVKSIIDRDEVCSLRYLVDRLDAACGESVTIDKKGQRR